MILEPPDILATDYEQRRREHAEQIASLIQATRRPRMAPRPPKWRAPDGTKYPSICAAARAMGIPEATLWKRIQRGTAGEWKRI